MSWKRHKKSQAGWNPAGDDGGLGDDGDDGDGGDCDGVGGDGDDHGDDGGGVGGGDGGDCDGVDGVADGDGVGGVGDVGDGSDGVGGVGDGDGDDDGVGGGVFLEYFHLLAVAWTDHGHAHHVHWVLKVLQCSDDAERREELYHKILKQLHTRFWNSQVSINITNTMSI